MTTLDFEARLRADLHADADAAPAIWRDWDGPLAPVAAPRPGRGRRAWIVTVAAAVVLAGAVVGITRHHGDHRVESADAVPPGTEYPLVDGGPATSTQMGGLPAVGALARVLRVADQPDLVVSTVLAYFFKAREPEVWHCLSQLGSAGCGRDGDERPNFSVTSSVDNHVAGFDLWTWANVPAGTAYVTYDDGDQHLWQRPVAGVVLFPNVPGDDEVVVAHDADGGELGRVDRVTMAAQTPAADEPVEQADLSQAQYESLVALTNTTMGTCLTDHGGTVPASGDVATFAAGVDQLAVWSDCVASTTATVRVEIESLGVRFDDARTEQPKSPGSSIVVVETSVVDTTVA